jgi:hypothetical protein
VNEDLRQRIEELQGEHGGHIKLAYALTNVLDLLEDYATLDATQIGEAIRDALGED